MNKKTQGFTTHLAKIDKNTKMINSIVTILIFLGGIIYACFTFIYQSHESTKQVEQLWSSISKINSRIDEVDSRIKQNEKDFNLTATRLETSLARISTDIQYIKEQFIRRGMDK